jgi:hypothetical protein
MTYDGPRHFWVSEPLNVEWAAQGKFVRVSFDADDRKPILLSMPAELAEKLQAGIALALRHRA